MVRRMLPIFMVIALGATMFKQPAVVLAILLVALPISALSALSTWRS